MANDLLAKPGTPLSVRVAEVNAAPAHKVKDLATHVYKRQDGAFLMTYYEVLQRPRQEVIDALIAYEVAAGIVVDDGSAPKPAAAPAPTPVAVVAPAPVAPQPTPVAAPWSPAPTPTAVTVQPQVTQAPPSALEPVQSPRPSRRSQAKAAQATAPVPTPAPEPVVAAPAPTPVVAPTPAPVPTPVITRMEVAPQAPVAPSAPVFQMTPPSAPAFVPPTPVAAPVAVAQQSVDLTPVLARLDKITTTVVNLDAKTDHMLFVLYHLFSGMYGQTVQQNNIKTFSDFKKYIQAISTPQ